MLWGGGSGPNRPPNPPLLSPPSRSFIGSGIRHCFTRNLAPHLPRFSSYLALVGAEAVACLFLCLTAERFGRRAVLLLCTVLTGISSLLLLALTQCKAGGGWAQRDWVLGGCRVVSPLVMSPPPPCPLQTCWTSSC